MSKKVKNWNDINGKMKVWLNDRKYTDKKGNKKIFTAYSASVSCKDAEDEWHNMYFNVIFAKDVPTPDSNTEITVTEGFITCEVGKDGKVYPRIVIMDWE